MPYFKALEYFLEQEKAQANVYPPENLVFNALNLCPLDKLRVVILGQDPYHGKGQAMGLCFSVPKNVPPPPSLKNIFTELHSDLGIFPPGHGNLQKWCQEGVLLLNTLLTVREHQPLHHANQGWEQFTDAIIHIINQKKMGVVFLLWGLPAQKKCNFIDTTKHVILKAAHPSPLSSRNFFGCKHFSGCNASLIQHGQSPIDWSL